MQRRRHVALTACAFACLALFAAPGAQAHSTPPTIVTSMNPISPALPPGIEVGLTASIAEELFVTNSSPTPLEVLATTGEPFLRIARSGVEANLASRDWWTSNDPNGAAPVPPSAKRGAPADWVKITTEPTWAWFDHRLHPAAVTIPLALQQANRSALLSRWSVPMRVAGQVTTVSGQVTYEPLRGGLLVRVDPPPAGIVAQILQGRLPGVLLTAPDRVDVAITGSDGSDFARITSRGVEVWTGSPTWVANVQARGEALSLGPPRWLRLSTTRSLTWLDPRLSAAQSVPSKVRNGGRTATVATWRIGLSVGGRAAALTGRVDWVPSATAARSHHTPVVPIAVGVAALIALLTGSVTWLRRRSKIGNIAATKEESGGAALKG